MKRTYISFNQELSLEIMPHGCEVLKGEVLVMPGNKDMGTFLSSCDGETDLDEILKRNTDSPEHFEEACRNITPVVDALLRKAIIFVSATPNPVTVRICRSGFYSPSVVALELTDRCNLRCSYCYQECSPSGRSFLRDPLSILEFLRDIHVRVIELTGGEPTLHPEFMPLLDFACRHFSLVGLITNGTLVNDEMMQVMTRGGCLPSVQVCLDGPNKDEVDRTDGMPGAWERIIRGIKLIKSHGVTLRVGMVLDCEAKLEQIEDTLLVAKDLGADTFLATPAIDFGRARGLDTLGRGFMAQFFEVHQRLKEKYGDFYSSEAEILIDSRISAGCGAGQRSLTLNPDGLIKICSLQPSSFLNFGHIRDIRTSVAQDRLKGFAELPAPNSQSCEGCHYLTYCMRCYTRAFSVLGSGAIDKSRCRWYQENSSLLSKIIL